MILFTPLFSYGEEKGISIETIDLAPGVYVKSAIHIYSPTWHDGAVQGFQALIQLKPSTEQVEKIIKLEWYNQTGKCPLPEQVEQVKQGWEQFLIWAPGKVRFEYVVEIFHKFDHKTSAPGPKIMAEVIRLVRDWGSAAIYGFSWFKAFGALRPDVFNETTQVTASGAGSGPVSATGTGTGYGGDSRSNAEINNSANPVVKDFGVTFNKGPEKGHKDHGGHGGGGGCSPGGKGRDRY